MPGHSIDRRQFLSSAAATTAFFAMHDRLSGAPQGPAQAEPKRPHLLSLELLADASTMTAMRTFYGKTLDLRLMNDTPDRFTVEAGESQITFVASDARVDGRAPFYHFAFNIPENKIVQALEWRREWDSNPRYGFPYGGFQDRCHQPLGHPSAGFQYLIG